MPKSRRWIAMVAAVGCLALAVAQWGRRSGANAGSALTTAPEPKAPSRHPLLVDRFTLSPAALAPTAVQFRVEGVVLGPTGEGAPGASLALSHNDDPAAQAPVAVTTAGHDGRFDIPSPGPGTYRLMATASSLGAAATRVLELSAVAPVARVSLQLQGRSHTLKGHVLDSGGGGVVGALLTAWSESAREPNTGSHATSDGNGAYTLPLGAGAHRIAITANGYGSMVGHVEAVDDEPRDFHLEPGARIAGRVIDGEAGEGVAGVALDIVAIGSPNLVMQTLSGDDGAFEAKGLDADRYEVWARRDGQLASAERTIELGPASNVDGVIVTLRRGRTLRGVVRIEGRSGAAHLALHADTGAYPPRGGPRASLVTNGDGRFSVAVPAQGRWLLVARAAGYADGQASVSIDDQDREVVIDLIPSAVVQGTVRDQDGRPVGGADITALVTPPEQRGVLARAAAGPDGAFRLDRLPAGSLFMTVEHDGRSVSAAPRLLDAGATVVVDVMLAPPN